jgi:hypothetical protein
VLTRFVADRGTGHGSEAVITPALGDGIRSVTHTVDDGREAMTAWR